MEQLLADIPAWMLLLLVALGTATFTLSTISGGGGAMLQIPVLNLLLGAQATAPVINLGAFISRPTRIIIFWKYIVWRVFWYYVPSAMLGAILAAWAFSAISVYTPDRSRDGLRAEILATPPMLRTFSDPEDVTSLSSLHQEILGVGVPSTGTSICSC